MLELETIKTRVEGKVLFASFSNPPLNLFGPTVTRDLVTLVRHLESGDDYNVVVFSSAVPDFFIAHVDMLRTAELRAEVARLGIPEPTLVGLFYRLSTARIVTIAEVAGRVRGVGSEFVLACDMAFASRERAIFGQPEGGAGVIPGAGGIQHLTRLMGRQRAMEVILGADDLSAESAEAYGWINRALPDAELGPFVNALAHRIASFPRAGIATIKERINAIALAPERELQADSSLFGQTAAHPETQARVKALFARGLQQVGELDRDFGRVLGESNESR
jgi:enoyl-CoA hydratase/carnithine racemase